MQLQRLKVGYALLFLGMLTYEVSLAAGNGAEARQESVHAEWTQFRGPDRSGVADETGLLHKWPPEGPRVLWRRALGEGFSAIAAKGELLYTLFADDEFDYAVAIRMSDGSEVWRREIGKKFHDQWGNGPRSTPTIDGDILFVVASYGKLLALDRADGDVIWSLNLQEKYPPSPGLPRFATLAPPEENVNPEDFAHASSPLVEGDLLIVYTGSGSGKSLVALNKKTGGVRWTALDNFASFSSPTAMTLHGKRQIVSLLDTEVVAVGMDGELLWRFPLGWSLIQPVFVPPDRVFVSAALDVGGVLLGVSFSEGEWAAEPLWRNRLLRTGWSSAVVYEGSVYGFDHATLRCLSLETGDLAWAKRGFGKGSLVVADGLLIILSDRGQLVLAETGTDAFRETGRFKAFEDRTWTAPTLAGGKLFVRNHQEIAAFDLKTP